MKLKVLSGFDTFDELGEITTFYDRITEVSLRWKIRYTYPSLIWLEQEAKEKGISLPEYQDYNRKVEWKFSIEKLSKGEKARQKGNLTHKLISEELTENIERSNLYIRLRPFQIIRLRYFLRDTYLQGKDFWRNFYDQIVNYAVIAVLAYILGFITPNGCQSKKLKNDNSPTQPIDSLSSLKRKERGENKNDVADSSVPISSKSNSTPN